MSFETLKTLIVSSLIDSLPLRVLIKCERLFNGSAIIMKFLNKNYERVVLLQDKMTNNLDNIDDYHRF